MKWTVIVATLLVGLTLSPSDSSSQDKKKPDPKAVNLWMKAKTKLSGNILVGLTEGDFDKIKTNAAGLNLAHYFEGIYPKRNELYIQQANAFEMANNELIRQAEAKNIYGATLAYNQLTVSCVQCHVVVRGK